MSPSFLLGGGGGNLQLQILKRGDQKNECLGVSRVPARDICQGGA